MAKCFSALKGRRINASYIILVRICSRIVRNILCSILFNNTDIVLNVRADIPMMNSMVPRRARSPCHSP